MPSMCGAKRLGQNQQLYLLQFLSSMCNTYANAPISQGPTPCVLACLYVFTYIYAAQSSVMHLFLDGFSPLFSFSSSKGKVMAKFVHTFISWPIGELDRALLPNAVVAQKGVGGLVNLGDRKLTSLPDGRCSPLANSSFAQRQELKYHPVVRLGLLFCLQAVEGRMQLLLVHVEDRENRKLSHFPSDDNNAVRVASFRRFSPPLSVNVSTHLPAYSASCVDHFKKQFVGSPHFVVASHQGGNKATAVLLPFREWGC